LVAVILLGTTMLHLHAASAGGSSTSSQQPCTDSKTSTSAPTTVPDWPKTRAQRIKNTQNKIIEVRRELTETEFFDVYCPEHKGLGSDKLRKLCPDLETDLLRLTPTKGLVYFLFYDSDKLAEGAVQRQASIFLSGCAYEFGFIKANPIDALNTAYSFQNTPRGVTRSLADSLSDRVHGTILVKTLLQAMDQKAACDQGHKLFNNCLGRLGQSSITATAPNTQQLLSTMEKAQEDDVLMQRCSQAVAESIYCRQSTATPGGFAHPWLDTKQPLIAHPSVVSVNELIGQLKKQKKLELLKKKFIDKGLSGSLTELRTAADRFLVDERMDPTTDLVDIFAKAAESDDNLNKNKQSAQEDQRRHNYTFLLNKVIQMLVNDGYVDPNAYTAARDDKDFERALLEASSPLETERILHKINGFGDHFLHTVVRYDLDSLAQTLVARGADCAALNSELKTPRDVFLGYSHTLPDFYQPNSWLSHYFMSYQGHQASIPNAKHIYAAMQRFGALLQSNHAAKFISQLVKNEKINLLIDVVDAHFLEPEYIRAHEMQCCLAKQLMVFEKAPHSDLHRHAMVQAILKKEQELYGKDPLPAGQLQRNAEGKSNFLREITNNRAAIKDAKIPSLETLIAEVGVDIKEAEEKAHEKQHSLAVRLQVIINKRPSITKMINRLNSIEKRDSVENIKILPLQELMHDIQGVWPELDKKLSKFKTNVMQLAGLDAKTAALKELTPENYDKIHRSMGHEGVLKDIKALQAFIEKAFNAWNILREIIKTEQAKLAKLIASSQRRSTIVKNAVADIVQRLHTLLQYDDENSRKNFLEYSKMLIQICFYAGLICHLDKLLSDQQFLNQKYLDADRYTSNFTKATRYGTQQNFMSQMANELDEILFRANCDMYMPQTYLKKERDQELANQVKFIVQELSDRIDPHQLINLFTDTTSDQIPRGIRIFFNRPGFVHQHPGFDLNTLDPQVLKKMIAGIQQSITQKVAVPGATYTTLEDIICLSGSLYQAPSLAYYLEHGYTQERSLLSESVQSNKSLIDIILDVIEQAEMGILDQEGKAAVLKVIKFVQTSADFGPNLKAYVNQKVNAVEQALTLPGKEVPELKHLEKEANVVKQVVLLNRFIVCNKYFGFDKAAQDRIKALINKAQQKVLKTRSAIVQQTHPILYKLIVFVTSKWTLSRVRRLLHARDLLNDQKPNQKRATPAAAQGRGMAALDEEVPVASLEPLPADLELYYLEEGKALAEQFDSKTASAVTRGPSVGVSAPTAPQSLASAARLAPDTQTTEIPSYALALRSRCEDVVRITHLFDLRQQAQEINKNFNGSLADWNSPALQKLKETVRNLIDKSSKANRYTVSIAAIAYTTVTMMRAAAAPNTEPQQRIGTVKECFEKVCKQHDAIMALVPPNLIDGLYKEISQNLYRAIDPETKTILAQALYFLICQARTGYFSAAIKERIREMVHMVVRTSQGIILSLPQRIFFNTRLFIDFDFQEAWPAILDPHFGFIDHPANLEACIKYYNVDLRTRDEHGRTAFDIIQQYPHFYPNLNLGFNEPFTRGLSIYLALRNIFSPLLPIDIILNYIACPSFEILKFMKTVRSNNRRLL